MPNAAELCPLKVSSGRMPGQGHSCSQRKPRESTLATYGPERGPVRRKLANVWSAASRQTASPVTSASRAKNISTRPCASAE